MKCQMKTKTSNTEMSAPAINGPDNDLPSKNTITNL